MSKLDNRRISLMNKIIEKGGMLGMAAKMYIDNPENSNGLVKEFFEQCHNKSLWDFWGRELVLELIKYRLDFLRCQFENLYYHPSRLSRLCVD